MLSSWKQSHGTVLQYSPTVHLHQLCSVLLGDTLTRRTRNPANKHNLKMQQQQKVYFMLQIFTEYVRNRIVLALKKLESHRVVRSPSLI